MDLFIHIGMPKSASTTIQRHLFGKHPQINYISLHSINGQDQGEDEHGSTNPRKAALVAFYSEILKAQNFNERKARAYFEEAVLQHTEPTRVTVLSHEGFLNGIALVPFEEKARRLQRILPEGKIILVLRNQLEYIKSHYRMWPFDPRDIYEGDPVPIKEWVEITFATEDNQVMDILKYDELFRLYSDLFGSGNVLVLCMESLRTNMREFTDPFSTFLGIDADASYALLQNRHENTGMSRRMNLYRRLNRRTNLLSQAAKLMSPELKEKIQTFLKRGKKDKVEVPPETVSRIHEFFRASNANLEETLHLTLSQYNYST